MALKYLAEPAFSLCKFALKIKFSLHFYWHFSNYRVK